MQLTVLCTPTTAPVLDANLNSTVGYTVLVTGENDTSWNFPDVVCEVSTIILQIYLPLKVLLTSVL